jgi:hypothetical protein
MKSEIGAYGGQHVNAYKKRNGRKPLVRTDNLRKPIILLQLGFESA